MIAGIKNIFRRKSEEEKKLAQLRTTLPIDSYEPFLKLKDGYYRLICSVSPVNGDNLNEEEMDEVVEQIQELLNSNPGKIQIKVSSEPMDIESYEDYVDLQESKANNAYFLERILSYKDYIKSRKETSRNQKRFYIIFMSEYKDLDLVKDDFETKLGIAKEKLDAIDMKVVPLSYHDTRELIYKKLNPMTSKIQTYDSDMSDNDLLPAYMAYHGKCVEVDGMFYRSFAIVHYPKGRKRACWFKSVLNMKGNVELDIHLLPGDPEKVEKQISRSIMELETRLAGNNPPHLESKYIREKKSAERMLEEIQDDASFHVVILVTIFEETKERLEQQSKKLLGTIRSIQMRAKAMDHRYYDPFFLHLPVLFQNTKILDRFYWQMHSKIIASIMPFDASEITSSTGTIWGYNPSNDSFIIIDRFDRKKYNNGNGITFGGSGSGKTFAVATEIDRNIFLNNVDRIVVIDPEREYKFPYGQRINFEVGGEYCTNPFHIESTILDTDDDLDGEVHAGKFMLRKVVDVVSWFKWIYPDMDKEEISLVSRYIREMYRERGLLPETENIPDGYIHPTLSDFDMIIKKEPKLETFRNIIDPYVYGEFASLFNGQTNWDMNNRLTVLDIYNLQEGVQEPLYDLILRYVSEEFKKDREERCGLYADEGHVIMQNDQTIEFVVNCYKRFRKYSNYIEIITQQVNDVLSKEEHAAQILANSTFKKYMYMKKNDYEALQKVENLSKEELKVISKRVQQGRGIIIAEDVRAFFQSEATLDQLEFLNPKRYKQIMGVA